ncbi:hypothetical protein D3C81_1569240 [compost metagenome]
MAVAVDPVAAVGAAGAFETGTHGHGIQVPALVMVHAPVNAQAFAFELDRAAIVAGAGAHAVGSALQAVMTDKETDAMGLCAGIAYEQVRADLKGVAIGEPQLLRAGAAWF